MESIFYAPTNFTPLVDFSLNGSLLIEGKSIPEDAGGLFAPLTDFANEIDFSTVDVTINLEYFNTETVKWLMELLLALDRNPNIVFLLISWHYQENDRESYNVAELYAECLNKGKLETISHFDHIMLSSVWSQYNVS